MDDTTEDYLHTSLAPSFGGISSPEIQKMDDNLKIMISGLMHTLANIPPIERTWDKILSAVLQSSVLKPHHEPAISRRDHFDNVGTHAFKIHGDPDAAIVKKVRRRRCFRNFAILLILISSRLKNGSIVLSTTKTFSSLQKLTSRHSPRLLPSQAQLSTALNHSLPRQRSIPKQ